MRMELAIVFQFDQVAPALHIVEQASITVSERVPRRHRQPRAGNNATTNERIIAMTMPQITILTQRSRFLATVLSYPPDLPTGNSPTTTPFWRTRIPMPSSMPR